MWKLRGHEKRKLEEQLEEFRHFLEVYWDLIEADPSERLESPPATFIASLCSTFVQYGDILHKEAWLRCLRRLKTSAYVYNYVQKERRPESFQAIWEKHSSRFWYVLYHRAKLQNKVKIKS